MNEITRIHLGRQPFTISVDAHKALKEYLDAIKLQVGKSHKEVINEVELRMAELLLERGITGEKTVVLEDITYLKEQLGKPDDFRGEDSDTEEEEHTETNENGIPKRLYRDEKNGMAAGVAAGLAAFFNIDVVIVRLIFVVLTIAWGWGALVYLLLWIVVPPAKTTSERLHMKGKAVTVSNLSAVVNRELAAAAERAGKAGKATNELFTGTFKVLLAITGIIIITLATTALAALTMAAVYLIRNHSDIVQEVMAFPVGATETIFAVAGFVLVGMILVWLLLIGTAMTKRKWTLPGWVTASMIGVFLMVLAVGGAVAPDAVTSIQKRYDSSKQVVTRNVDTFNKVEIKGDLSFHYKESDDYKVELHYFGKQKPSIVTTKVTDGKLLIDADKLTDQTGCDRFCIAFGGFAEAIIYAPKVDSVELNGNSTLFNIEENERFRTIDQDGLNDY